MFWHHPRRVAQRGWITTSARYMSTSYKQPRRDEHGWNVDPFSQRQYLEKSLWGWLAMMFSNKMIFLVENNPHATIKKDKSVPEWCFVAHLQGIVEFIIANSLRNVQILPLINRLAISSTSSCVGCVGVRSWHVSCARRNSAPLCYSSWVMSKHWWCLWQHPK